MSRDGFSSKSWTIRRKTMTAQPKGVIAPEVFLEHKGVRVYRTYQFDDPVNYSPSPHLFTTAPDGAYHSDPFRFDVRTLVVPAASAEEGAMRSGEEAAIVSVIQQAIERGMITAPGADSGTQPVHVVRPAW
jgi:hypothetical protein